MKLNGLKSLSGKPKSPPGRGAWIEIMYSNVPGKIGKVAPRAGGVD